MGRMGIDACTPPAMLTGLLADLDATFALGQRLGRHLPWGVCLTLQGELGAGKTSICRGIASGAGASDPYLVTSPTYALVHEYPTPRGLIIHLDVYRLSDEGQALALGLEDQMARQDALVLVEWAERIPSLIPARALTLVLEFADEGRHFKLLGPPDLLEGLL